MQNAFSPTSKVSIVYHSLKSKVQGSEVHYKIKIKENRSDTCNIQCHRIYTAVPKGRDENRKYWTKTSLKTSWANSKLCISITDAKALFRSPTPFGLVRCSTLLFLGLVPHPVSRFPRHVYHTRLWHLQHHEFSNKNPSLSQLRAVASPSLSQLHTVASLGPHAGTPLTHI